MNHNNRLTAMRTNDELLNSFKEIRQDHYQPKPNPTMTYRVDASQSEFPKWKKLKLQKGRFAVE